MYMLYSHHIFVCVFWLPILVSFLLPLLKKDKRTKSKLELSAVRVLALEVVRSTVRKNPTEQCSVVSCEWNPETIRGSTSAAEKGLRGRQKINVQQTIQCQKWSLLQNKTENLFFSNFYWWSPNSSHGQYLLDDSLNLANVESCKDKEDVLTDQ